MKLEEYLKAIKECPDEMIDYTALSGMKFKNHKLTAEWGVYDNYSILLNANIKDVVRYLSESSKYFHQNNYPNNIGAPRFHYIPGTVIIPIHSRGGDWNEKHYSIQITLHPYQDKKIENISFTRAIAMVIDDIGQFILKENISACIPTSRGWKYLDEKDPSRIVVHEPVGPIVSEYLRIKNK